MSISSVSSTGYSPVPDSAGAARLDRHDTPRAGTVPPAAVSSTDAGGSAVVAQRTQPAPSIGSIIDVYL